MMQGEQEAVRQRLTRRQVLQVGSLGTLGLSLPALLRAEAHRPAAVSAAADSCIVIFLNGGPSHLDMWDMKPQAPTGIRGEFNPISTTVPGVQFSEHLPRMAQHMHRSTLIRSAHHGVNNSHAAAVYAALTGHDRGELGGGAMPTDYPAIGSVTGHLRPPAEAIVPFVSLPYITKEGAGGPPQPGFFGGWLGKQFDPLFVLKDPNAADFSIPELTRLGEVSSQRLTQRRDLQSVLNTQFLERGSGAIKGMDGFQQRAFDLLSSEAAQKAFQLSLEPEPVREAYGRNIYGQSTLLARRLVEAGTRVVTISWAPDANATWDTHGSNFVSLKDRLLPQLDMAVGSLLQDLADRSMLSRTLVCVMGEFGRTPKINGANGGRDHWNFCYSLLMAGGGMKGGYVHGSSDKIGGEPASEPVTPAEIVATIYQALGISPIVELRDATERPYVLVPWGDSIDRLFA
ncbi:MAG: DUF1501 domain-containing protein [Planctomycetota bacterium]